MAEFQKVLTMSELAPGTSKMVQVAGNEIGVFNIEGKIYAIENNCAHQGGPLTEGTIEGNIVTCPYHNWKFDVTTGDCTVVPTACQNVFDVKIEGEDILVKA